MLTHLAGKQVVRCDACHKVIGEAEMVTWGRGYVVRDRHLLVSRDVDPSIDACSPQCASKASDKTRSQKYRCPDCVSTNQDICDHRRR